jgi:hypothetical protein
MFDVPLPAISSGSGADARITTRVVESDPFNCFYSTIHEVGHHFGLSDDDMHALEDAAEDAAEDTAEEATVQVVVATATTAVAEVDTKVAIAAEVETEADINPHFTGFDPTIGIMYC